MGNSWVGRASAGAAISAMLAVAGMARGAIAPPDAGGANRAVRAAADRASAVGEIIDGRRCVLKLREGYTADTIVAGTNLAIVNNLTGQTQMVLLPRAATSVQPMFIGAADAAAAARSGLGRFYTLSFDEALTPQETADLQAVYADEIAALNPGVIARAYEGPNDPLLPFQWAIRNRGQPASMARESVGFGSGAPGADLGVDLAWAQTRGDASVWVAVLDTGVASGHPDLAGRIAAVRSFVPGENPAQAEDDDGHGTHVAGIIAATSNNAIGVSGAAPGCRLAIGRVLEGGSGSFADIAAGIVWAADLPNVRIINMSLGIDNFPSIPEMDAAISYAASRGKLVVAAAGNSLAFFDDIGFPGRHPSVVGVGSTDARDRLSYFSDFGPSLDITAPGEAIISTVPGGYASLSGTSMASPYAAAVGALIASRHPEWTASQIRAALASGAVDRGPLGFDQRFGAGRASAAGALGLRDTCIADFDRDGTVDFFDLSAFVGCFADGVCDPGASADIDRDGATDFFDYRAFVDRFEAGCGLEPPSGLSVLSLAADDGEDFVIEPFLKLAWSESNTAVSGYEVEIASDPARSAWTGLAQLPGANSANETMSADIPGLPYGRPFALRMRSVRGNDVSEFSSPIEIGAITDPAPSRPASITASATGAGDLAVSWTGSFPQGTRFLVRWWPDLGAYSGALESYAGYYAEQSRTTGAQSTTFSADLMRAAAEAYGFAASDDFPVAVRVVPFLDWDEELLHGSVWAPPCDKASRSAVAQAVVRGCLSTPGRFRASSVSGSQVCFLWDDTASCETRFVIQQSIWNGAAWSAWELGENVPPNRGDACRTGLPYNAQYRFRIRAENDLGEASPWSSQVETATGADCLQPPANFRVASVSGGQVCLLWGDTSSCEERFVIQQSAWNGASWGAWELGENVPPNRGDACRTGLPYSTLYRFRVRSESGARSSPWSNEVQATTGDDCLQAPGNFRLASVAGNQVCFLWNDTSSCETRFVIEQSRWNGSSWDGWTLGENVPPNRGDACRTGLAYNTRYRFRIAAEIEPVRGSPWSNVVEVTTGNDCLSVPGNFRISGTGCGSVTLAWADTSSCETRFVIDQSRWDGSAWGAWTFGENVPANATTAARTGLAADGLYRFRIRADIEGVRSSPWTTNDPEARATPDCLNPPTSVRAGTITRTSVQLLWNDNSSCDTSQQIWQRQRRSDGSWTSWTLGENVPADRENATRDGLSPNTTYQFYVLALRGACDSGRSSILEVRTRP
jgi:subtilisin family serine protease